MRIIGAAADEPLLDLETGEAAATKKRHDFFDFGHDFRADAVAGQEKELEGCHGPPHWVLGMWRLLTDFAAGGKAICDRWVVGETLPRDIFQWAGLC